ncbi:YecA family protein [Psychrobacillus sp. NPDC096389]|uniref:YecA family protein n=1 Tax=Psychrobacillus sp. NPDC096389 TaxID=3364490 RepID=UPI003800F774
MTVGRNDLCPCGSGKKYKKCHGGAAKVVSIQKVVDEELNQIIRNFYIEYPEQKDRYQLNILLNKWTSKLKGFWPINHIEKLAVDYFLLLKQKDIWQKYIERQLQKAVRPSVKEVLEKWMGPMMIIGEVTKRETETVTLKEIIDGKVYILDTLGDTFGEKGDYVIGMVLPDARKGANALMVVTGISFMPNWVSDAVQNVKKLAKKNGLDTQAFYLENMLGCLELISKSKKSDVKMTEKQIEMQGILEDMLINKGVKNDELLSIFGGYLQASSPNPRKAEAVAAGAFRFGKEHLSSQQFPWTNKDIAEMFGVSTSTVQKYFEEIEEFFFSMRDKLTNESNKKNIALKMGT